MNHQENKSKESMHDCRCGPSKEKFTDRIQRVREQLKKMNQELTITERIKNVRARMASQTSTQQN